MPAVYRRLKSNNRAERPSHILDVRALYPDANLAELMTMYQKIMRERKR